MPYFGGFDPTDLATSDRQIAAQNYIFAEYIYLCLGKKPLYAKSQGSAHLCTLCRTVLRLTPNRLDVLNTYDR